MTETATTTTANGNGAVGKMRAFGLAVKEVGFPAIMLAVALGWLTGWLPFRPLEVTHARLIEHDSRLEAWNRSRERTDETIAAALDRASKALERIERRDRLVDCLTRFTDPELRRRCLDP